MALHNVSPVREQLRSEILATLAHSREPMTTGAIYEHCPSAVDAAEVARLAYELKKKGVIADGGKVLHPLGMMVNSYILASPEDPRIEAAKTIVVERKIPRTVKGTKTAATHPFNAPISPRAPQDRRERVTRDLPIHLTTTAPQAAAVALDEAEMSEEPMPYITEPDTFNQEPREPEAEENIDSHLVDALLELAHLEPEAMAAADVGEIAAAMAKKHEIPLSEAPHKICQCVRINRLPHLPPGYVYGGVKVWIDSKHDVGRLTLATVDEEGGAFITLKASGRLAFDAGDLVTIGQVADALIRLHDSMGGEHE